MTRDAEDAEQLAKLLVDSARNASEEIHEAEDRFREILGADRASLTIQEDKTSLHITWKHE